MNEDSIHRPPDNASALDAIGLIALTLVVLGRLCAAEFVQFDDPLTIANNPALNPPSIAKIARYWVEPEGNLYIPLTYSVWGGLAFIARVAQPDQSGSLLNPWVFHTANVLIHCATTLIAWLILRAIIRNRAAAWIGAAVFAIHPLQVETVAWASGTKDLLCGLFVFASIYAVIRYRAESRAGTRFAGTLFAGMLCVVAACLAKPTGIVAPAMAMVVDVLVCRTPARKSIATLWSWWMIAIVFAAIGSRVQPPLLNDTPAIWIRPLVTLDAVAFYCDKIVRPIHLALDYGRTPARIVASGAIYWTWILPVMIAIIALLLRRKHARIVAALSLAVIGVAPVLGLIPFTFQTISTTADHYVYLSMLGVALLVATLAASARGARIPWLVGGAILIALSVRSFVAAGIWQNNSTLFSNAIAVNPHSALSHTNWGVALARHGDEQAALDHFRQAVAVDPDYAFGHSNLGGWLRARGRYREAADEYRELLRVYRKQRNFNRRLGDSVQKVIDQLEALAARSTTQPATRSTSREED